MVASSVVVLACGEGFACRALSKEPYADATLPPFGSVDDGQRDRITMYLKFPERGEAVHILSRFDAELGWVAVLGVARHRNQEMHINSIGARGATEFSAEPSPDRVRIVAYGDSFVFGTDVADGEDWPAVLGTLDERLEVINMGVGGYGTDQALLRLRRTGRELQPRVVVMGFLLENVGRNVNRWRSRLYPRTTMPIVKPRFVLDAAGELELVPMPYATRSDVYRAALEGSLPEVLSEHEYWLDSAPLVPGSQLALLYSLRRALARRDWRRLLQTPDNEPMRVSVALLEESWHEASRCGATDFVVVVFPTRQCVNRMRADGSPFWQPFLDELERRGVPFVDATEWIAPTRGRLFGTGHLNARGNRIVADGLRAWIDENVSDRD